MNLKQIRRFFRKYEPRIAKQFEAAIDKLGSNRRAFIRALREKNVATAMLYLNIDESIFSEVQATLREAFNEAGTLEFMAWIAIAVAMDVQPTTSFFAFHPRATQESTGLAHQFGMGMSDAMENNVRRFLIEELDKRTPSQLADMVLGKRAGGILGLSERQTKSIQAAADELDNDKAAYFRRAGRDKRFDKAVRDGKFNREEVLDGYAKRMENQRAMTIARTEVNTLLNFGRYEALQQLVDAGLPPSAVQFIWKDQRDARVRDAHRAMNEQIRPFGTPFTSPTGGLLRFPGDTSLGAGPEDIVNCRCWMDINIGDT